MNFIEPGAAKTLGLTATTRFLLPLVLNGRAASSG